MSTRQRFRSLLKPDGTNLKWVIAHVLFSPQKVWKTRNRMRVKGAINGFTFRTSLFGSAEKGYVILVNKSMQKGAEAYAGEMAEFTLEPDLEERAAAVPPELAKLLKRDRAPRIAHGSLTSEMPHHVATMHRHPPPRVPMSCIGPEEFPVLPAYEDLSRPHRIHMVNECIGL